MNSPSAPTLSSFEAAARAALASGSPQALVALAHQALHLHHPQAEALVRAALAAGASPGPAHYLLGLALRQAGKLAEATTSFEQTLALSGDALPQPLRAEVHEQLAQIAQQRGDLDGALASWEAALALRPEQARSWNNLAMVWRAKGATDQAQTALREALRRDPNYARAWINLGELRVGRLDLGGAIEAFEKACALDSQDFSSRLALGRCLVQLNRYAEAEGPLREARALSPEHPGVQELLAGVLGQLGALEDAQAIHLALLKREPERWNARIALELALPDIYTGCAHLAEAREQYARGLARLLEMARHYRARPGERFDLRYAVFALAYQGLDDLPLQRTWASFVQTLAQTLAPRLCEALPTRRRAEGERIRVGFVSSMLRAHTVGNYFGPWLTGLDPARFEVYFYNLFRGRDAMVERFEAAAAVTRLLPGATQGAAELIRADQPDVLIYTDVGMDYLASILPVFRLAPLQLAAWGHPVTTGFASLDGFLSSRDMEPPQAARHYAEPLLLLPGIGTRYALPELPPAAPRSAFGLSDQARLYLNPQSLFKVHPDNDAMVCELMRRDPEGVFLFFRDPSERKTRQFADRLARAMREQGIAPRGQVKFLPRSDPLGFRALIQMADVLLDTQHWSGGNTALDALACGVPLVTLPGEFMRGRQSAAMLRAMGLDELVAGSSEEYLARALHLAAAPGERERLETLMHQRRGAVFDRPEAIAALSQLLEERAN